MRHGRIDREGQQKRPNDGGLSLAQVIATKPECHPLRQTAEGPRKFEKALFFLTPPGETCARPLPCFWHGSI